MGGRKKILLVEDDRDMMQVILDLLEEKGFEAIGASDHKSAFMALEKEKPSLLLLDIMLPDGDGFDICRMATDGLAGGVPTPVVILSAKSSIECKMKSFMNGATKYFTKPFDVEELLEAIQIILRRRITPYSVSA